MFKLFAFTFLRINYSSMNLYATMHVFSAFEINMLVDLVVMWPSEGVGYITHCKRPIFTSEMDFKGKKINHNHFYLAKLPQQGGTIPSLDLHVALTLSCRKCPYPPCFLSWYGTKCRNGYGTADDVSRPYRACTTEFRQILKMN
jgi:hypothetical protein